MLKGVIKNSIKIMLYFVVTMFLTLSISVISYAESLIVDGTVQNEDGQGGSIITNWSYNAENNELTLTGNGKMAVCNDNEGWRQYRKVAKKIIIKDGITTVSDMAFYDFIKVEDIVLADTIISIERWSFSNCKLNGLILPSNLVKIEESAFWNAIQNGYFEGNYTNVVFPDTLESVANNAFYGCFGVSTFRLSKSLDTIAADAFDCCNIDNKIITLYCTTDKQIEFCKIYDFNYIDANDKCELVKEKFEINKIIYTGKETKPNIYYNNILLSEGLDYDAIYSNNTAVGNATVHITGKGAYYGEVDVEYEIQRASIANIPLKINVSVDGIIMDINDQLSFDGELHYCKIDSIYYNDVKLNEGVDYKIKTDMHSEYMGAFTSWITGINNYSDTYCQGVIMYNVPQLSDCKIELVSDSSVLYTGEDQSPKIKISYGNYVFPKESYDIYWWETDDRVWSTRYNFVLPGKGSVKIEGKGYDHQPWINGNDVFEYEIKSIDLTDADIFFNNDELVYRGWNVTPIPIVTLNSKELSYGTDFTVTYESNNSGGTAVATIEGCGGYFGTIKKEFDIKTAINVCSIEIEEKTVNYTGEACRPAVDVKFGNNVLVQGKDYEIQYENNVDEGVASIIVTGLGKYVDSTRVPFNINKQDLSTGTIFLDQTIYTYDGKDKKPGVKIEYAGKTLIENTDYSISYTNSNGVGVASVTAVGKGVYKGTLKAQYTINPISIDDANVNLKDTIFTYDGSAKKPSAEVKLNGTLLIEGEDYVLSYRDNINEGTAYAIIEGIGIYSGTVEMSFKILAYNSGMDSVYKEEDTVIDDNYIYHIIDIDDKEVEFSAPANKKETNVVIPSTITTENGDVFTVTSVGEKAFYKNTKIKKLTIANTVTSIENYAFYGCKNLTSIKIGNGIEIIGDSAFRKCTKLSSITLPKSIDKLGKNCFYGCKKLKTITIKSNQVVDVQSNAIKGISKKCVIKVPKKLVKKYKKEFNKKTGFQKTMKIKKQ